MVTHRLHATVPPPNAIPISAEAMPITQGSLVKKNSPSPNAKMILMIIRRMTKLIRSNSLASKGAEKARMRSGIMVMRVAMVMLLVAVVVVAGTVLLVVMLVVVKVFFY